MKMNYGYKREDKEKRVHYICRGVPFFHSPVAQERSDCVCGNLRYTTRCDRKITQALDFFLQKQRNTSIIKHNTKIITSSCVNNPIALKEVKYFVTNPESERKQKLIDEKISDALSLDLTVYPRSNPATNQVISATKSK